jgi:hypothetical protein
LSTSSASISLRSLGTYLALSTGVTLGTCISLRSSGT